MSHLNKCMKSVNFCYSLGNICPFSQFLFYVMFLQEYQEYLQMEKRLLEELGIREESDDLEET